MARKVEVILYGKKVNLGSWAKYHPGGQVILETFHNRDATEQFESMHSAEAKQLLFTTFLPKSPLLSSSGDDVENANSKAAESHNNEEEVLETRAALSSSRLWSTSNNGSVNKTMPCLPQPPNKVSEDFALLRKELEAKGLFKADIMKEFLIVFYTIFTSIFGSFLVTFTSYLWTGLLFMLLGLSQAGWVAHDYLHHAVLPSVRANEIVGEFLGCIQGYDKGWWKARHNLHHVTTNEVDHDPDISIAPLFHFVQQYPDLKSTLKHIQKFQHYYYIPMLPLLDIDWRVESIIHVYNNIHIAKFPAVKLLVHYICVAYMMSVVGVHSLLLVSLVRGFITSVIVFSSHYTEQRFVNLPSLSLAEQTAYTTRNISGGAFINFISGNISLQIEHHLFPTMPPHNLIRASPYVRRFLADHNLPYNESSIFECVSRLVSSLNMNLENIYKT